MLCLWIRLHELVYTCTSKLWEKESINNRMRQEWMHLNQLFCFSLVSSSWRHGDVFADPTSLHCCHQHHLFHPLFPDPNRAVLYFWCCSGQLHLWWGRITFIVHLILYNGIAFVEILLEPSSITFCKQLLAEAHKKHLDLQ